MGIDAEMFARTRIPHTRLEVTRLAADLAEAFGPERFWIFKDGDHAHHALSLVDVYEQDGDDIVPEPGETLIRVHLGTRYYGEGYERGDWPLVASVARWLRHRVPDAKVWYGGDSSGVCAVEMTPSFEAEMWGHFATFGHQPYSGAFGRFTGEAHRVTCAFCGDRPLSNYGGGRGDAFLRCDGCGSKVIACADGKVHVLKDREEFFEGANRIRMKQAEGA